MDVLQTVPRHSWEKRGIGFMYFIVVADNDGKFITGLVSPVGEYVGTLCQGLDSGKATPYSFVVCDSSCLCTSSRSCLA